MTHRRKLRRCLNREGSFEEPLVVWEALTVVKVGCGWVGRFGVGFKAGFTAVEGWAVSLYDTRHFGHRHSEVAQVIQDTGGGLLLLMLTWFFDWILLSNMGENALSGSNIGHINSVYGWIRAGYQRNNRNPLLI